VNSDHAIDRSAGSSQPDVGQPLSRNSRIQTPNSSVQLIMHQANWLLLLLMHAGPSIECRMGMVMVSDGGPPWLAG
jgi:hypothetical protein